MRGNEGEREGMREKERKREKEKEVGRLVMKKKKH